MKSPVQFTKTIKPINSSRNRSTWRRGLLLPLVAAAACVGLSPARAVTPPPGGGYPNTNTAAGEDALFSLTTGFSNTALGAGALYRNTTGNYNTGVGAFALEQTTTGRFNTGIGGLALVSNSSGDDNTAVGVDALNHNTTGSYNTAVGGLALYWNKGSNNTATGFNALGSNTTGTQNTATGLGALHSNTTGSYNTADGLNALNKNTTGNSNTAEGINSLLNNTTGFLNSALGDRALLRNTTGSNNIAVGAAAGSNLTTGSNNIDIGNYGVAGESNTIRLGKGGTQTATFIAGIRGTTVAGGIGVFINANGRLGTATSSKRFKEAIQPMDKASEALLSLKPVTFRYKQELDPEEIPQFGLVAEEVEKVNPDLVVRDEKGEIYSVRYDAVNAMLLNEFLKQHRTVAHLKATVAEEKASSTQLKSTVTRQQQQIEHLTASMKEQASLIQKVSAQLEVSKLAPQVVSNE